MVAGLTPDSGAIKETVLSGRVRRSRAWRISLAVMAGNAAPVAGCYDEVAGAWTRRLYPASRPPPPVDSMSWPMRSHSCENSPNGCQKNKSRGPRRASVATVGGVMRVRADSS